MESIQIQLIFLLIQSAVLFFVTKTSLDHLHIGLYRIFRTNKIVYPILALIYLPGTLLHELAHLMTALALGLKVRSMNIFPVFDEETIRLGEVVYEKKDFVRSILVGTAPFFNGLGFLYFLSSFSLFPNQSLFLNLLFGYLIFAVSSTMFSSRQDLKELVNLIPVSIVVAGLIYIFNIQFNFANFKEIIDEIRDPLKTINLYLFFSVAINVLFIIFLRLVMILRRR